MSSRIARNIPNELIPPQGNIFTRVLQYISIALGNIAFEIGKVADGRFATGHIRLTGVGTDTHTVTITVNSVTKVYELDSGGGVTGTNVAVTIGASASATATNLTTAITTNQGTLLTATADGSSVDLIVQKRDVALTLSNSGGSFVVQDNGEERDDELPRRFFTIKRTITAEDVTRGKIVINTGMSGIIDYMWKITDTTNVTVAWNGVITVSAGTISFDNSSTTDWAATNILYVWILGYE